MVKESIWRREQSTHIFCFPIQKETTPVDDYVSLYESSLKESYS